MSSMSLDMASEGEERLVQSVRGESDTSARLREMGFVQDAVVRVIKSDGRGLIVGLNGCRLALSRTAASRVMVA